MNKCNRKYSGFHKDVDLNYVMEVSEIVIIHESIKLICHMLKGLYEVVNIYLGNDYVGKHG